MASWGFLVLLPLHGSRPSSDSFAVLCCGRWPQDGVDTGPISQVERQAGLGSTTSPGHLSLLPIRTQAEDHWKPSGGHTCQHSYGVPQSASHGSQYLTGPEPPYLPHYCVCPPFPDEDTEAEGNW